MNKAVRTFNFKKFFSDGREKEIYKLLERKCQGFDSIILINHYHKTKGIDDVYCIHPHIAATYFFNFNYGVLPLVSMQYHEKLKKIKSITRPGNVWDISTLLT